MNKIRGLIQHFLSFFKIIEENTQLNVITSVSRNKSGMLTFAIGPLTNDHSIDLTCIEILDQKSIKKQLHERDLRLVNLAAMGEGDIIVDSKEYNNDQEQYYLRSVLTNEKWRVTISELESNSEILGRLNKKYFNKILNLS